MAKPPKLEELRKFTPQDLLALRTDVDRAYQDSVEAEKRALRDRWVAEAEQLGLSLGDVIGSAPKGKSGRSSKTPAFPRELYHHPKDKSLTASIRGKLPKWATDQGIDRTHMVKARQDAAEGPLHKISGPENPLPK